MRMARRVPEVLQSSLMDCGPAALSAVLRGFGVEASYDAIRARCQTDVDGTSIHDLARLARELGLGSRQVLVPRDTLLLPSADCLPAIAVTSEAAGALHFVVLWRTMGPYVEVMDPSSGRSFERRRALLARLPDVPIGIPITRFDRWRETRFARAPLVARLAQIGVPRRRASALVESACGDPAWQPYARLDAATRMLTVLMEGGAVARGREAARLHETVLERALDDGIPATFWWVTQGELDGTLRVRGAPIVQFRPAAPRPAAATSRVARAPAATTISATAQDAPPRACVAGPLAARPTARGASSLGLFLRMLRVDAPRAPLWLLLASLLSTTVALVDVFMLQGLLHVAHHLTLSYQRVGGVLTLLGLCLGGLALELTLAGSVERLGRRLELRMRAALFEKLPRLPDDYLRTRSTSDMAQRGHALHLLHQVPRTARRALDAAATLLVTTIALGFLNPGGAALTTLATALTIAVPWGFHRAATERMLRARTHTVALDRFYLDALLGTVPIRVHGAEQAVRREHETLLVDWARATHAAHAQTTAMHTVQAAIGALLAALLAVAYLRAGHPASGLLLIAFWSLRIPQAGAAFVESLVSYRFLQHAAVRFFAPIDLPTPALPAGESADSGAAGAAHIGMRGVSVQLASRALVSDLSLELRAGEHVAIVGASGAGKSTLVGLLLGFQAPTAGELTVDGRPLAGAALASLRARTVWVDPAVQLWNDTLMHNVLYGADAHALSRLSRALEDARLTDVLENLPEGLQAVLGESGARVSGGQGQRVRVARGLMREHPRLVILDEPFRGLERPLRRALLERLRARFRDATLLFVSHDVRDTQGLERVLVLDGGRVVEDGTPAALASAGGPYQALLEADARQQRETWSATAWRRVRMVGGKLEEAP